MQASELMTNQPACCTPDETAQRAAQLMKEHDCGCIPVVEDTRSKRVIGVVTDRDLACRGLAAGKGPDTAVREVMTKNPTCCHPEDQVADVERVMAEQQIRRVPVVDARGCCVGMIAQADLALNEAAATDSEVGRVVERISEPAVRH
ncbi:MAG: CBS domain-containing protein [Gemmatimonadales bacterium]